MALTVQGFAWDAAKVTANPAPSDPKPSGWGPISRYVAANLVRLRQERGLSTTRLSAALEQLGQPIPATGITRIEKRQRRVDTDDLIALALALNVSPLTLLLPHTSSDVPAELTTSCQLTSRTAWQWAEGQRTAMERPSDEGPDGAERDKEEFERRQAEYLSQAEPPERRRSAEHPAVRLARTVAEMIEELVSPEPGGDLKARARSARRRVEQLGIELEEIDEQLNPRPVVHPGVAFDQLRERLADEAGTDDKTDKDEPGGQ